MCRLLFILQRVLQLSLFLSLVLLHPPPPAFSVTSLACVLWKRPNFATQDVTPSSMCIEERFVFISFNYASVYVRVSAGGSQRQQLPWNWSHRQL